MTFVCFPLVLSSPAAWVGKLGGNREQQEPKGNQNQYLVIMGLKIQTEITMEPCSKGLNRITCEIFSHVKTN